MNKFITLVISLPIGLASYCQHQQEKSYFDVLIGPSVPLGKLADKDGDSRKAGFAKTGEYIKLSALRSVNNRFSFGAIIEVQRNPLSTTALENFVSKINEPFLSFGSGFPQFPPPPP